jgi:hypothetical protein
MLFDRISKAHCVQILSCFSPRASTRLTIQTSLPNLSIMFPSFFHSASIMTWITPSFNYKYPSMCVHTSHQPCGYSRFTLHSWQWAHRNSWCSLWQFCYHWMKCWFPHGTKTTTCASFNHIQLHLSTG